MRAPFAAAFAVLLSAPVWAQGPPRQPDRSAREVAPVDFTGTWVSPVMEDWRWRMVTPLKGDAASIPLKAVARAIIDSWDPARDEAEGQQCKAYGAPGLLRIPGRLRISWQDDSTLKIEADQGRQTRLLHFGGVAPEGLAPNRQGYSAASWDPGVYTARQAGGVPGAGGLGVAARRGAQSKAMTVSTTHLLPGYLRKNGVPYSDETTVTEYFERFNEAEGAWITVTTIVTDPVYLGSPFVTTTDFRREPNDSAFDPTPCSAR